MRHLVLLNALMILGGASVASAAPGAVVQTSKAKTTSTGERCQRSNVILAQRGKSLRGNKLGELLPATSMLTVVLRGRMAATYR